MVIASVAVWSGFCSLAADFCLVVGYRWLHTLNAWYPNIFKVLGERGANHFASDLYRVRAWEIGSRLEFVFARVCVVSVEITGRLLKFGVDWGRYRRSLGDKEKPDGLNNGDSSF